MRKPYDHGSSELDRIGRQVLFNHKGDFEDNSVIKFTEVKTCQFFNFFKSVYKSISVNEKLSRSFGNIQVILKEFLNGEKSFVIERIDAAHLKNLVEESLAESCGKMIDRRAIPRLS